MNDMPPFAYTNDDMTGQWKPGGDGPQLGDFLEAVWSGRWVIAKSCAGPDDLDAEYEWWVWEPHQQKAPPLRDVEVHSIQFGEEVWYSGAPMTNAEASAMAPAMDFGVEDGGVICSICGGRMYDWDNDGEGMCHHVPGREYTDAEGKPVVAQGIITGGTLYMVSVVHGEPGSPYTITDVQEVSPDAGAEDEPGA